MIRLPVYTNARILRLEQVSLDALWKVLAGLIKRAFDFTVALIGLIVLSPVFVLIAILIKRDSPGPVFYRARRVRR